MLAPRPRPAVCSSARKTLPCGRALCCGSHRRRIGRSDLVEMVKMLVEDSAAHQRPQNFRQQQIRNRAQSISRRRMARHIHAQAAQLLNQTPDFRAMARNLLRNLRPAHHHGSVLHEQAHDAPQAQIGGVGLMRRQRLGSRRPPPSCCALSNAEIMRELPPNNNRSLRPEPPACSCPRPAANASAAPPK